MPEVGRVPIEPDSSANFGDWVASRGPSLQRFAFLVCGSAADAPDLVQEALIGAMPRWESLAKRGTADAYVRRSILNASVSRWRSTRRLVTMADPVGSSVVDAAPTLDAAPQAWR